MALFVNILVIFVTDSVACLKSRYYWANLSRSISDTYLEWNISENCSHETLALCSEENELVASLHLSFAPDLRRFRAHLTFWSAGQEQVKKHPSTSDNHLIVIIGS